jgi:hypothetical protein
MSNRQILVSMLPVLLAGFLASQPAGGRADILYSFSPTPEAESRTRGLASELFTQMARAFEALARFEAGEIDLANAALREIAAEVQAIADRYEAVIPLLPASQVSVDLLGEEHRTVIALATNLLRLPTPTTLPDTAALSASQIRSFAGFLRDFELSDDGTAAMTVPRLYSEMALLANLGAGLSALAATAPPPSP